MSMKYLPSYSQPHLNICEAVCSRTCVLNTTTENKRIIFVHALHVDHICAISHWTITIPSTSCRARLEIHVIPRRPALCTGLASHVPRVLQLALRSSSSSAPPLFAPRHNEFNNLGGSCSSSAPGNVQH